MDQSTRTDITVNVEGFWMLQALLDIRHVAPELRCRPFVSTDSMDWLNQHPGMAIMREQGIVDGETVNDAVAARMRVLAAPDLEIVALLSRGKLLYGVKEKEEGCAEEQVGSRDIPDNEFRVLLARRGQHWVSAVRVGDEITVDDVAIADTTSIATLVFDALESIHHAEPAAINAVNVPLDEMLEITKAWQSSGFNVFSGGDLRRLGISAATVAALGQALSDPAAEGRIRRPDRDVSAGADRRLERGLARDLPGYSAVGAGRCEDRPGDPSLRRVEDAQQSLTNLHADTAHAKDFRCSI
jgi:EspG family